MSATDSDSGSRSASVASGKRRRDDGDNKSDAAHSVERLARSVCRHLMLAVSQPSVREHRTACRRMTLLRDELLQRSQATNESVKLLLTAGITVHRHLNFVDDEHERGDFQTTQTLLFALLVLCDRRIDAPLRGEEFAEDVADATATVRAWHATPLVDYLWPVRLPSAAPERVAPSSSADNGTLPEPPATCEIAPEEAYAAYATLWLHRHLHPSAAAAPLTLPEALRDASAFFAAAMRAKQFAMLLQGAPSHPVEHEHDFLTLDIATTLSEANDDRPERLAAIVDTADSEAGQMLLRDLALSFELPASVVGVRRVALLSRAASNAATEQHPEQLGAAHDAAMRGAPWVWAHPESETELHRSCALLAGLALICLPRDASPDAIRKDDAFSGRVHLPFLQAEGALPGVAQLCLIPHRREWVLYKWLRGKATPHIMLRQVGFEGLCSCALMMADGKK